jgi:hypothetical protein
MYVTRAEPSANVSVIVELLMRSPRLAQWYFPHE